MPADTFAWLHLTDLHFGLKGQSCLWPNLRQPFLDDLAELHERCGPWDAVLFTGDLVQSGESAELARMQSEVLAPLWERLAALGSGDARLIAVPGNHDLYRPNPAEDNPAIDALLELRSEPERFARIAAKFWDQPGGAYRRVVDHAFAAYRQWWEAQPHRPANLRSGAIPGDLAATLECGGHRIGLIGLNTAFLQLGGGDYRERLVWDPRQLQALCPEGIDRWTQDHALCLLLTHHGPDWLTPDARAHGESEIAPAGRFALHLFGHMHETRIGYTRQGGNPSPIRQLQGCSVFGMERFCEPPTLQRAHGYSAGRIRFGATEAELRLWPRIATKGTGPWRYVPDYEHAHLLDDQGTAPETLAPPQYRPKDPAGQPTRALDGKQPGAAPTAPAPVGVPTPTGPAAPHSTLPARRPFFGRGGPARPHPGLSRPRGPQLGPGHRRPRRHRQDRAGPGVRIPRPG